MSKPTADWERIGDRFYRKTQLYTSVFDPDLEIENYVVTGAPYSGAVGTHKDRIFSTSANIKQQSTVMQARYTPSAAPKLPNPPSTYTAAPAS